MTEYYRDEDLDRFSEIGGPKPDLFKKFMEWDTSALAPGALSKRKRCS